MQSYQVLYLDDEMLSLKSFEAVLKKYFRIQLAESPEEAFELIARHAPTDAPIGLVVADQRLGEHSGIEFLSQVGEQYPSLTKILLTGFHEIDVAVEAVNKAGIFKYITKPWHKESLVVELEQGLRVFHLKRENQRLIEDLTARTQELHASNDSLQKALEEVELLKKQLEQENTYLREKVSINHNFNEIITNNAQMKGIFKKIQQSAQTNSSVLITGETGTGKELIARAIHNLSSRKNAPFIKINCASLPSELIESELFGHNKGAFTGALSDKAGKFEIAHKGTIFLDEIGELPLSQQAKLLRVLQEQEFERLGSNKLIKVDVRVITATNRNLQQEIELKNFREDLFYRLNVFPIHLPPLRERLEDLPLLVHYFIEKYARKMNRSLPKVPAELLTSLQNYHFPGNVRELENLIERAMIISEEVLSLDIIPKSKRGSTDVEALLPFEEFEKKYLIRVLQHTKGKIQGENGAATLLQMAPSTLRSRLAKLGIQLKKTVGDM
ncbi:MAG: sigma-54-dependent Fis family transcriptional regulator [Saprospiraceae bacterium]|nr:sigma-54-dependent Fis family transcriptional regulator [Saprospiraceae bacterium]